MAEYSKPDGKPGHQSTVFETFVDGTNEAREQGIKFGKVEAYCEASEMATTATAEASGLVASGKGNEAIQRMLQLVTDLTEKALKIGKGS